MIVGLIIVLGIAAALNWRKAMTQLATEEGFLARLQQQKSANREEAQSYLRQHPDRPVACALLDAFDTGD